MTPPRRFTSTAFMWKSLTCLSFRWPPPPRITPPLPQQDWYADGVPMDRTQAATALKNQFELEKQMSNALNQLNSGSLTDLKATLLSAQSNVGELSQYFSHKFRQHSHFYNERRAEDSTTACKVFDIPELLEMVLQYLDVTDVLSIYQCSRNIRDSIDGSSQLQQQLSLRAAPVNSHLHFPLRNLTHDLFGHPSIGFSTQEHIVQGRRRSLHERKADPIDDPTAEVHACFYLLSGQVLPGVGSRIRKMFITQPPIEEMYISLDCCPSYEYPDYAFAPQPSTPVREIVKKGGLTVGDLYDRTKKLLDEHRYCPSAYSGLIQDDGSVRVGVRFVGKMTLQPDDPLILDWQKQQRKREDDDREYHNKTAKFEAFCNAKRNGKSSSTAIYRMTAKTNSKCQRRANADS